MDVLDASVGLIFGGFTYVVVEVRGKLILGSGHKIL